MLLNELDGNIAICLYLCSRQMFCVTQFKVVPEDTIMCQCKGFSLYTAGKGVIIVILFRAALRCHPRVSHDGASFRRNTEMQPMRRQRTLVNLQPTRCVVGDAGGVGTTYFCCDREFSNQAAFLRNTQRASIVNESEQTAHQTSASLSIGSFTYKRRSFKYCTSSGCVQPSMKLDQDMAFRSSSVR